MTSRSKAVLLLMLDCSRRHYEVLCDDTLVEGAVRSAIRLKPSALSGFFERQGYFLKQGRQLATIPPVDLRRHVLQ